MAKVARVKAAAAVFVARSRDEADETVRMIGELQRQREVIQTGMNERLAALKAEAETQAAPISAAIKELSHGVQVWAEANRETLCKGGVKTVKLGNGELRWRMRPPSVTVRGAKAVLEALKRLGLDRFIRTKEELDRERVLAEPEAVQDIKGLSVGQSEDFVIVPFATELEEVA
jgi:phage host-nuclease inhibitor protein Gam